jgi:hypothetical protein
MTQLIVAFFSISAYAPKENVSFGLKKRDIYMYPTPRGALLPSLIRNLHGNNYIEYQCT